MCLPRKSMKKKLCNQNLDVATLSCFGFKAGQQKKSPQVTVKPNNCIMLRNLQDSNSLLVLKIYKLIRIHKGGKNYQSFCQITTQTKSIVLIISNSLIWINIPQKKVSIEANEHYIKHSALYLSFPKLPTYQSNSKIFKASQFDTQINRVIIK